MHTIKLHDIDVEFPFKPYLVQVNYMSKVIQALKEGKNALLESPTGTGKTLCLLCATLAWRRSEIKKRVEKLSLPDGKEPDYPLGWGGSDNVPGGEEPSVPAAPRIIYASRTHSQIAQVVSELKRTAYAKDAKISILGSREQMCIHPEVSKQSNNTAMIHSCRNKVTKHLCHFYNNVENARKAGSFTNEVLDIEELVALGKKRNACPYYAAREQSKEADCGIIFTPYNYLLDRKARRSHNLEVAGNVIIFDEAHNLEKMCEESASFDLSSLDIAKCIQETGELLKAAVKMSETGTVPDGYEAGESSALGEFNLEELATLKALFVHLEKHLQDIQLLGVEKSITKKGRYMFEFLSPLNVNFGTHEAIIDLVDKVVAYLSTLSNSFQTRGTALQKFSEILKIIFSAAGGQNPSLPSTLLRSNVATEMMMDELSKFYRVHIREEEVKTKMAWGGNTLKNVESGNTQRTLSYWCFSPGYAMRDLIACGVKNLILTSGTLSPIDSFTCELQVDFPITLQNTHVIDDHQVFVATLTKGLTGRRMESTYKTRGDYELTQDLGHTIMRISRNCPGGLLVFFPSYVAMEMYTKAWGDLSTDIMRQIDLVKPMTIETRNKQGLKDAMEKFYSDVAKPQGASFFAICRGKVSEGLDFANNNGRAVVIVGLPFPPAKDAKVRLKMQFLEDLRKSGAVKVISGQEWYRLQALRAVNQAIGRVIRHRYDYGAIILCDYRYSRNENRTELPKWIQPRVNQFDDAEKAIRRLKSFFCSIHQKEKIRLKTLSNQNDENGDSGEGTSGKITDKSEKEGIFFGGQRKKESSRSSLLSQYFAKSNDKIPRSKNKTFLSIPKTNDLTDHLPSSVLTDSSSIPQSTPNGSCTGCPGGSIKRRRTSEDEDSLVPIKNLKKKSRGPALLDALDKKDNEPPPIEEEVLVAEESSNKLSRALLIMDKVLDDQRRGLTKKKIKIVEKKVAPVANVGKDTSVVTNVTAEKKIDVERLGSHDNTLSSSNQMKSETSEEDYIKQLYDFANWDEKRFIEGSNKLYLIAVRKVLQGDSYNIFKKMIVNFSSNKDVSVIVPTLSKIFLSDERSKMLFRAFIRYYKKKDHVEKFVNSCEELTGKRPAGY